MSDQNTHPTFHRHLSLPNDVETIPQLNELIDLAAEEVGLDMSLTMGINLALEEAVVNVMDYGYPPDTQGMVDIEVISDGQNLKFIISDSGIPFDPTSKAEVDTNTPLEERQIGGLGIHLVRQIMDIIQYERVDGMNRLTLIKKI